MSEPMCILVTLDRNYIPYLNVMLTSLLDSNPGEKFNVYLLHSSLEDADVATTRAILGENGELILVDAAQIDLEGAPTTSRYPKEIYYRIFAAKYLPRELERVLYLDPDLVVNGRIRPLYELELGESLFAAASHTGPLLHKVNELRLDMDEESLYINSGVMLMNLEKLREEQDLEAVFRFIEKRKNFLMLPDQDIISSLYGSRIYALDTYRYNMTERLYQLHAPFEHTLNLRWVEENAVIIHYCGRNKPWKENYVGQLGVFYRRAAEKMEKKLAQRKI